MFLYQSINNLEAIISKFYIEKNNLIKFILLQTHYYIEYMLNNYESNIQNIKNFFDNNTIYKLINILYEYTFLEDYSKMKEKVNDNINDIDIINYNIIKLLLKLSTLPNDYFLNIITNDNNIHLLILSVKYYYKKNQLLCNLLLVLLNNCYLDNDIENLQKYKNIIQFLFDILSNFKNNPIDNIIQSNLLLTIIDFLTELLNDNTFDNYMNNPYVNNCILLMINIIQNYDNENIKYSSIKCLAHLLHCIDENNIININNFENMIFL